MPTRHQVKAEGAQRIHNHNHKESEPKAGLAAYMRGLPFLHPERVAYLNATKPGSPAGSAPRTIQELQALASPVKPTRKRSR